MPVQLHLAHKGMLWTSDFGLLPDEAKIQITAPIRQVNSGQLSQVMQPRRPMHHPCKLPWLFTALDLNQTPLLDECTMLDRRMHKTEQSLHHLSEIEVNHDLPQNQVCSCRSANCQFNHSCRSWEKVVQLAQRI